MSAVTSFRSFDNQLREEPFYYIPVGKGIINSVIGSLQLLVSEYMKRSSYAYHQALASRHVEIGTQALKRGCIQILPTIATAGAAYFTYQAFKDS